MTNSMLLGVFDWIAEFFKELFNLIPKVMYLLYASLACVLDVLQLFFRKLAGLDVYYVDGKAVSGDLVTNFIGGILGINLNATDGVKFEYSALTTVFYSFVVFGIIICFASTLIAIIKSHYTYDDKSAKGPMQYVYAGGKAIINMVAVPIIVVLGLYVSQAILTALDSITSTTSGSVVSLYGSDKINLIKGTNTSKSETGLSSEKTYIYYDIFGFGAKIAYGDASDKVKQWTTENAKQLADIGSANQTFSGSLFRVAAYNANRARLGQYTVSTGSFLGAENDDYTLFGNAKDDENLAEMIDTAFACHLYMDSWHTASNWGKWSSDKYFTNFLVKGGWSFSKFNVGLVWYYYDLWQFNFIVGFAGCLVCVTLFINIIMGLITRLFMCIGLFLVAPPLFGLAPLDGGKAGKSWRENFMKQVLMAYGAVVGMNLFFLILPYMNEIDFFNIGIADYFARILIIIVGLVTIKAFIAMLSGLVGGADANETGGKISEEVMSTAGKAAALTVGAAKVGAKAFDKSAHATVSAIKGVGNAGISGVSAIGAGISKAKESAANKRLGDAMDATRNSKKRENDREMAFNKIKNADANKQEIAQNVRDNMKGESEEAIQREIRAEQKRYDREAKADLMRSGYTSKQAKEFINIAGKSENFADADKQFKSKIANDRSEAMQDRSKYMLKKEHETNRASERIKLAGGNFKAGGKNIWTATKSLGSGFLDTFSEPLTKEKSIGTFLHESKIKQKPNFEKDISSNTAAMLDLMKSGNTDRRTGMDTMNSNMNKGLGNSNENQKKSNKKSNDKDKK